MLNQIRQNRVAGDAGHLRWARLLIAHVFLLCLCAPLICNVAAQSTTERSSSTSKNNQPTAAKSSQKKPKVFKTVDPCAIASAEASLNLGPGVLGVQASSNGGTYHEGGTGCGLFVVDITVPSDSSGPSGSLPSFRIESGPVELILNGKNVSSGTNYEGGFALPDKVCALYHQQTRLFVKSSTANDFTLIKTINAKAGTGQPFGSAPKCVLMPEIGYGQLSYGLPFSFMPLKSNTRVFRVAVGVTLGFTADAAWQKVRVQAAHDADIK
jgi:hypothetical protein